MRDGRLSDVFAEYRPRAGVEGRMQFFRACLLGSSLLVAFASTTIACTTETKTVSTPAATEPDPEADEESSETTEDAGAKEAAAPKKDAAPDVAPKKAEWTSGETGKSCADACKAKGKTCAVACSDRRSCGGHDGEPPPYAGYACYYRETKSSGGSFRSNEGRSLLACDDVATSKWNNFGSEYTIGDYLGSNPVSCCCQ